jgi:quinoprotein glucose dehydrogenase
LKKLAAGQVPAGAQLELLEAAGKRTDPTVRQLLAEREDRLAASNDPLAPFRVALEGGDARAGGRIFFSQPVMACIRCHSAGNGGGDAGPNLAMIGKREPREYLLESVVKPNAKIAPGFDSVVVTLKSGSVVGGIVAAETANALKLRNADGKVVEVNKAEIAKREGAPSSMPEIYGAILSKKELRDVVAYLASLKNPPDDLSMGEKPRALHQWND